MTRKKIVHRLVVHPVPPGTSRRERKRYSKLARSLRAHADGRR